MNFKLTRTDFLATGIFGILKSDDDNTTFFTLEHAYPVIPDSSSASATYAPKIPIGIFQCRKGLHRLESMTIQFWTFEITGVSGHTNLLFHSGNFNADSSGCVLLGLARQENMGIMKSRIAFQKFMELQKEIDTFTLTVS